MQYYDVFNGDADGICALHQLRLADPVDSQLLTGLKRDIAILGEVPARDGDVVTVLDISLDRNREALLALLARGVVVRYFDHHYAGSIPAHSGFEAMIDASGAECTSALVDRHLAGRYRPWAVAGAFGDGLDGPALRLARALDLTLERIVQLRELGTAINYNAYGQSEEDVLLPPVALYRLAANYADPFEFLRAETVIEQLVEQRRCDLRRALETPPLRSASVADVYLLPDERWSRRVSGTFANRLARSDPNRAHAIVTADRKGGYAVSVRSPRGQSMQAVDFCRRFPNGGGRPGAAGIDHLEAGSLDGFVESFSSAWRH